MSRIQVIGCQNWSASFSTQEKAAALLALEQGQVLYFPRLAFPLLAGEQDFLTPAVLSRSKNVSYNASSNGLGGTVCQGNQADRLKLFLRRYADQTWTMLQNLLPHYTKALRRERTSLRPAEIAGRPTSWRKDDTRLHIDSFPSQPTQGRRLLRVFCNINPTGRARTWRVGEPFPQVAARFWSSLPAPSWVLREVFALLRVTKERRSNYDHYMLHLHDAMKADTSFQKDSDQETIDFPPGCAWACFTDQVSHAAMAGQHQLEQTFTLPVEALRDPSTSPVRVLETLAKAPLLPVTRQAA